MLHDNHISYRMVSFQKFSDITLDRRFLKKDCMHEMRDNDIFTSSRPLTKRDF